MNIEEIEKFLEREKLNQEQFVKIDFKKRDPVYGLFVKSNDFNDLKAKNFWRIVTKTHFDAWRRTKDMNLAKIFSGSDFSKLKVVQEA